MKIFFSVMSFSITIFSFGQMNSERVEKILNEIIEINSYTSQGQTKKLISFFDNKNFTKLPNQNEGVTYSKFYPDKNLDYTIIIGKSEIECVLLKNFDINWNKYEVSSVYYSLKSLMGLPNKTFNQAKKQLEEDSKKPSSKYVVRNISDNEFKVINSQGETTYVKSKFTDVFSKNQNPNFDNRYFEYNFLYVYPYNENAVFSINFGYFIDDNGNYKMWFKAPLKQNNLNSNIQIDSSKI